MASLYGEVDAIRVLLTHMPAQMKANEPQNLNLALSKVKIILFNFQENYIFTEKNLVLSSSLNDNFQFHVFNAHKSRI